MNITIAPKCKIRRRVGITILGDGDCYGENSEQLYRIVPAISGLNGLEGKSIPVVHPAYVVVDSASSS